MNIQNNDELADPQIPDFSTLTDIMDYFRKVPFETFKKQLNLWFTDQLNVKSNDPDNRKSSPILPPEFSNLIENIFTVADDKYKSQLN